MNFLFWILNEKNGLTSRNFWGVVERNLKIQSPTKMGQTILISYDAMITEYTMYYKNV